MKSTYQKSSMKTVKHKFVDAMPDLLDDGVLYVSIPYSTAIHRCACGCGQEVVTPFSPTDWEMLYNGITVSLSPSIGNWSFPCKSHYWIKKGKVQWAGKWSQDEIEENRNGDRNRKDDFFQEKNQVISVQSDEKSIIAAPSPEQRNWFFRLLVRLKIRKR